MKHNRPIISGAAAATILVIITSPAETWAAPYEHVLYLSIDGLHESDLADPNLAADMPNIAELRTHGVTYTNCFTPGPTDSFPGSMAAFTGATPKTTGIYYDHAFSRSLYAPDVTLSTLPAAPGTVLDSTGSLDYNSLLLGGGNATGTSDGPFNVASINPATLPQKLVNGQLVRVYPHELLQVNTVFDVAHAAGLRTAYIDKHPAYDILNGPLGTGLDDFYAVESDAKVKLEGTGSTAHLVDQFTTTTGVGGLKKISNSTNLSNAYDDIKLQALMNQIDGKTSTGGAVPGGAVPAIFGMNFIALNTAQRLFAGGIDESTGPSADVHLALSHTDASVGAVINELKANDLWNSTLIVLTAKHGNSPRVGSAIDLPSTTYTSALDAAGIQLASFEQDDSLLYWLADPNQTAQAKLTLQGMVGIDTIYAGSAELLAAGFGDPALDDRTPNLIVKLQPGYVVADSAKRAEHGGFSEDDAHVALIVSSGSLDSSIANTTNNTLVTSTQIAVTTLDALGLDPSQLQGAVIENTKSLPDLVALPEPSALALLCLGGLALLRKRPRKTS